MRIRHSVDHTSGHRSYRAVTGLGSRQLLCLATLSLVSLFMTDRPLRSQQATPAPTQGPPISVHVKVVNVLATVRDKKGGIVRNLTQDDFELKEDDRAQTIRYFAHETDLPLTLGLLVDTSLSQRRVLGEERDASATFLDQVLRVDKDQAFIIHFDRDVELLQDLTSSRQKLQAALNLLQTPNRSNQDPSGSPDSGQYPQGGSGGGPGGHSHGGWGGGGTTLYDSIYLASNEITAKQSGRKALIVLSDGVDHGSKKTLASAIEAAQRADTLVYSILFADEEGYGGGGGGGGYGHHGMGGGGWGGGMGGGGGERATLAWGGGLGGVVWVAATMAAGTRAHRKPARTARRFSNGSPRKPAGAISRLPRSTPSMKRSAKSRKNCAASTAWDIPLSRPIRERDITRSRSRRKRQISSCRHGMGTIRGNEESGQRSVISCQLSEFSLQIG